MLPRAAFLAIAGLCAAAPPATAQQPATPDAEAKALEDAFAPPDAPKAAAGPKHMDADVPPPKAAEQAAETPEERAERELASRLSAVGAETTDAEMAALLKQATALGALMALQVHERWAISAAAERSPTQAARAKAWLNACGPGTLKEAMRCRARALDVLGGAGGASKAEAAKVEEADRCVADASEGGDRACLRKAASIYQKTRDRLMQMRAALAALDPDQSDQRRSALKLCPEPRCATLRAGVLEQLSGDELHSGSPEAVEQAVRDALEAVKLRQSALPASERFYARTDALDRACAAHDRAAGRGKCRAMEQQVLGGYVFRDYSRKSAGASQGLPVAEAREVTDHYTPLLASCLQQHGEKSGSGRYKVRWTILNDGRVTNVEAVNVDPAGRLMGCLKSQFARWRYPKYRGEWQHVEQEFLVSGTTR